MNKIVIVNNQDEGLEFIAGLGYRVIHDENFEPEPDTLYLVIGWQPFDTVKNKVHLGLRRITWEKAVELPRVGIKNNISFIFCAPNEWSIGPALTKFNDPNITKCLIPEPPETEYICTASEAKSIFDQWIKEDHNYYGYDYETNGKDKFSLDVKLTGVGICTLDRICWFEVRRMDNRKLFMQYLLEFLLATDDRCVVFSQQFEYILTYNLLHKFINFIDLDIINVLQEKGNWNNLKWTARRLCNVNSWDDEFDGLSESLDEYLNDENETEESIRKYFTEESSIKLTNEEVDEVLEYAKEDRAGFYCIPMKILGKYCGLDCFYTLWSWYIGCKQLHDWNYKRHFDEKILCDFNNNRIDEKFYNQLKSKSDECISDIYEDPSCIIKNKLYLEEVIKFTNEKLAMTNLMFKVYARGKCLESRINLQGMVKDKKFFDYAKDFGWRIILRSATNQAIDYLNYQLYTLGDKYSDLSKYNDLTRKFISLGIDVTQGGYKLAKTLLCWGRYYNENYENFLDENLLIEDFGEEIANEIKENIFWFVESIEDISRKRSLFNEVGNILDKYIFKPDDISIEEHNNYVAYYSNQKLLEYIKGLPWANLHYKDFTHDFVVDGEEYGIRDAANFIFDTLNVKTPDNKSYLLYEPQTIYHMQLIFCYFRVKCYDEEIRDNYPSTKLDKITNFPKAFSEDFNYFKDHFDEISTENQEHANEVIVGDINIAWIQTHMSLLNEMDGFYPELKQWVIDEISVGRTHFGEDIHILTYVLSHRLLNKFIKSVGTYLEGTFESNDSSFNYLDENWVSDPGWTDDPNAGVKSYAFYEAYKQYSRRWSSGFHTVPSRSEVKKCMSSPPDGLLSYFDISSMEVRTAAYLSKDPAMLNDFESGTDVYINTARMAFPEADEDELYEWRTPFKAVLLGLLYGRGNKSIADQIGESVSAVAEFTEAIKRRSPVLYDFINYKSDYPAEHGYYLDTILGEMIETDDSNGVDRRHGINTVIQGFSANIAAYGFQNILDVAHKIGWKIAPIAIVHDSITNTFDIHKLWEIYDFYYKEFTQFIYDLVGVRFLFDVKLGTNYYDVCTLIPHENRSIISLKGSADAINQVLDKLDLNNIKYKLESDDLVDGRLPVKKYDPVLAFVNTGANEAIYDNDYSKFKVTLTKL